MNWGYKILIVYGIFIAGIMFMVLKSTTSKMDLVTSDYYGKELKYQDKIDEMNRVKNLSETIKCEVNNNVVTVIFPGDFAEKKITGIVEVYCPADESKDISQHFEVTDSKLTVKLPGSYKGLFECHINWRVEGVSYYFEKKIFL